MTFAGLGIFYVGAIWLIVLSAKLPDRKLRKLFWMIANLFFNPIAGIAFFLNYREGLIPLILCLAGFVLIVIGGIPLFD